MKYLFLIIRHMFPRKRWQLRHVIDVYSEDGGSIPKCKKYVLRDQFGNLKVVKVSA